MCKCVCVGWLVGYLVRFYGILIFLGYLMPNSVYIYIYIYKTKDFSAQSAGTVEYTNCFSGEE